MEEKYPPYGDLQQNQMTKRKVIMVILHKKKKAVKVYFENRTDIAS